MNAFQNDEEGYLAWHANHPDAFVFNHFGGTDAAANVLHRSTCRFLWRDADADARTVYEKWCADSEHELIDHANSVLGNQMWNRCSVCFSADERTA